MRYRKTKLKQSPWFHQSWLLFCCVYQLWWWGGGGGWWYNHWTTTHIQNLCMGIPDVLSNMKLPHEKIITWRALLHFDKHHHPVRRHTHPYSPHRNPSGLCCHTHSFHSYHSHYPHPVNENRSMRWKCHCITRHVWMSVIKVTVISVFHEFLFPFINVTLKWH